MTEHDQRVAIAEACGWRPWQRNKAYSDGIDFAWSRCHPDNQKLNGFTLCEDRKSLCDPRGLPNYLHDLNAMHDAEKTLTKDERDAYCIELIDPYGDDAMFATAKQRAEAFLRCKGLWRDE